MSDVQDLTRQAIFGHSMGGHGALTLYLSSRTKQYKSASAFAPIANPMKCPWGERGFSGYLQRGVSEAKERYDATELISRATGPVNILVDYVGALADLLTCPLETIIHLGHGRQVP